MNMQTKDEAVRLYQKRLRQFQRDERKKFKKHEVLYFGSENDYFFSEAVYANWVREQHQKKSYQPLYESLEKLKKNFPIGYKMIDDYFLNENWLLLREISEKYEIPLYTCQRYIKKSLSLLRKYLEQ